MKVCVIGTGYVGLVTGACLARIGHQVICVDNNEAKVKLMQAGQSPIYEPGLAEILQQCIAEQRIEFTTDLQAGVNHGDILFIAVGTPALPNGKSDTRYVEAVARGIGEHLNGGYKVIVNKSTVPIGSGNWVERLILDGLKKTHSALTAVGAEVPASDGGKIAEPGSPALPEFDVVSNPEFLREGSAVYDTFNPDRIVLGGNSDRAIALMQQLYDPLVRREFSDDSEASPVPVVVTDLASAEMIKYAANSFLATKISFINEVANICDRVGADVVQVARGIGLDSRIGDKFLQAGIGWGGSCFPKDVSALVNTAEDYGYEAPLLRSAVEVNQKQHFVVVEKLQQILKILNGKTVGLLGLTFKPDTDDMRDAPSLKLIEKLTMLGVKVKAFDPILSQSGQSHTLANVLIESDVERLAEGCDALVLVTDWQQFQTLNYPRLAALMTHAILVDGRNFLDRSTLEAAGFHYTGVGH
ncbi:UDP-glucose dehydrogenase family protein [Lyngbya confervoides]|uniref:UDP-glucose 6-dehydrogenase n=1 Tax=Lyngbya confervoides BDU141951 TaxID=1574623 RepID=A0ABD4SZB7_9CYAN|nr:UDP-glucose/GDP-mannose dehydrogenase family protein [Lyngbya confervoides]MCM1981598.1 UDP-glucose/GDP-mannose dehydrogenase family protein [Lyngbya confervoides BDU141951]